MLFNNLNYDDEQAKIDVLEYRVGELLEALQAHLTPDSVEQVAFATYELILAQIEAYYWQSPHLACTLRAWVTAVLQTGSERLDNDCIIFLAIKNNMPAPQLESLLEVLNG